MLSWILLMLWLLLWTNPFLLILFSECLRGWLDYPGHSVLFSRPLVASLEFSGGPASPDFSFRHPFGISLQDLSWRRLSSWMVLSCPISLLDTCLSFLFKTYRGVTWHPTGISFIFSLDSRMVLSRPIFHQPFLFVANTLLLHMLKCHHAMIQFLSACI